MHHLFKKLKGQKSDDSIKVGFEGTVSIQDIYRYRLQRGVNFGSWFVLERWIADGPFKCAAKPAQSDLDVARGDRAKEILEHHWDNWIKEDDWEWVVAHGFNTVRLPIGYYHICGAHPSVMRGTDFEPFQEVYCGAWSRITRAIEKAASLGIGILMDLHAAPGKQNNDAHAGTSERANFFEDSYNKKHTIHVLRSLIENIHKFTSSFTPPLSNIVGIELLNEPNPPSDQALQSWYTSAISSLRDMDPGMPLYIGECWRTKNYADYICSSSGSSGAMTVLDHHLYRCFTSQDINTSAEEHSCALSDPSCGTPRMLASVAEKVGRAGGGIVIGEWSGALNPGSLSGGQEREQKREYVKAQLSLFDQVCGGWYFWTYKKQHRGDSGWSLRDAVEQGVFPDFVGSRYRTGFVGSDAARERCKEQALKAHADYWAQYRGKYDHSKFADGFDIGWDDNFKFFAAGPRSSEGGFASLSEIGFKGAWARRRTSDHGKSYWEFETGFAQGAGAALAYYNKG